MAWKCPYCGEKNNGKVCPRCGLRRYSSLAGPAAVLVLVVFCLIGGSMATCSVQGLNESPHNEYYFPELFWTALVVGALIILAGLAWARKIWRDR